MSALAMLLLFDISSKRGLKLLSLGTDRAVKPALCGQQGIITFSHGAPLLHQLSHIEGRD